VQISLAARASIWEKKERETKNKPITLCRQSYEPMCPTTNQFSSMVTFQQIQHTGKLRLHWEVVNPMQTPFIPGQDPIRREEKRIMKPKYQCNIQTASMSSIAPPPKLDTSTHIADRNTVSETSRPDLVCSEIAPPVPSLCVCGCIQPMGWDIRASNGAA